MQEMLTPVRVEKESIPELSFKNTVPFDQDPKLRAKLEQATHLGNLGKVKFHIEFYSDSGLKAVQTTIWATGNKFICLKGGVWIPISRIVDIRFV
ncbi:hypothetical protein K6119_15960 [Paracrocinitomix mangrovi]|uniref:hypothetical protein n=1 Tax=Paracrocinitomix mangrovi TaxID=2862509 RepID=UPI001C8DB5C3|nr:hypothetical protein [Paracrocinitomix mangrovi]UKN01224.1 hypothetical protein K6119_15960 [Paracrocinitomix mangrovi]